MHRLRSRLTYGNVMATVAVFIALAGTTYAATGGNFILGSPNSATSTTALSSGTTGPALRVTSTNTAAGSSALNLNVPTGRPPLTVNSGIKVANLNADKLDGLDSASLITTSKLRRFNFEASIPTVFANFCDVGEITGLNLRNNHLVLTPERESTAVALQYTVEYSSASNSAFIKACNLTGNPISGQTTRFNLVAISP
jgi:hypothetical protein